MQKAEEDAGAMLESYLKEPSAENLHGLRTAARRTLTIFKLLPGKARGGKPGRRMEAFSRLLELTQKARHLDILLSRISPINQSKAGEALAKSLRRARDSSLRAAKRVASSLKVSLGEEIAIEKIDDSTLQKRFDKSAERLTAKIREMLPAVTKDSIKRKQLQRLRQDSRKLRYLLELSANPENSEKLSVLRIWQEVLAEIHDSDACIELLQTGKRSPEVKALVDVVRSERSQNLEKFKSIVEEKPVFGKI